MESPRYTVIIPMMRFSADEPSLKSLRETVPSGSAQILVALGQHPAAQRNAALALAKGEIIVFLDNDCTLDADYWKVLEAAFAQPEVDIVGGPARLRPHATAREEIFHAMLTHPLIVGPVSARYTPRGQFRATTQMELILCNLAARRSIFTKIGPLSTELYPNEENEWLDRAKAAGVGIYYQPSLQVFRPQRTTWTQLFLAVFRYGMGRTRQLCVSGWKFTPHQILPFILLVPVMAVILGYHFEIAFGMAWLILSLVVAFTCEGQLRLWERLATGLSAPLVPLIYAVGQLWGWVALIFSPRVKASEITVLDESGDS